MHRAEARMLIGRCDALFTSQPRPTPHPNPPPQVGRSQVDSWREDAPFAPSPPAGGRGGVSNVNRCDTLTRALGGPDEPIRADIPPRTGPAAPYGRD
jgi:hypothetical protein